MSNSKRVFKQPTTFIDLPAELRLEILSNTFSQHPDESHKPGVPLTSHFLDDFAARIKRHVTTFNKVKSVAKALKAWKLVNEVETFSDRIVAGITEETVNVVNENYNRYHDKGSCSCPGCKDEFFVGKHDFPEEDTLRVLTMPVLIDLCFDKDVDITFRLAGMNTSYYISVSSSGRMRQGMRHQCRIKRTGRRHLSRVT